MMAFLILVPLGVAFAFAGYAITILHVRKFPDGSARIKHFLGTAQGSREHKTPTARTLIRVGTVCLALASVGLLIIGTIVLRHESLRETIHRSLPG